MQADGDEAGLPRHETRSLCHQRQRLLLLLRLSLDNGDLRDRLMVFLDMWHRINLPWLCIHESGSKKAARVTPTSCAVSLVVTV